MSHENLFRADAAAVVLVDVQEKFMPVIHGAEQLVANCKVLLQGAKLLQVPVIATEQYPQGLGPIIPELQELLGDVPRYEKVCFSCVDAEAFLERIEEIGCDQVLLCGVETHVCVLQTALDLLDQGCQVHVATDAVGSRNPEHHRIALERMQREGVTLTCVESALFEMLGAAGTEAFKAISRLVK